jgi:hypothetical protein
MLPDAHLLFLWGGQFCPQPAFSRLWPPKRRLRPRLAALQIQTGRLLDFRDGRRFAKDRHVGAKFKDKVICTIRLKTGQPISGETADCSINVDENGDLPEADSDDRPDRPSPMLNPKLKGDTLTFESKDDDEVVKFEMTLA